MQHNGPQKTSYSLQEIRTIFRAVSKQLLANNEIHLQSKGIFRLAADENVIPKIIETCLNDGDISHYETDELADTLKRVLRNKQLIKTNHPIAQKLINELKKDSNERNEEEAINTLILDLLNSNDLENLYLAEIIHTYLYLAQRTSTYAELNLMPAKNLVISPIGKFICCNVASMSDEDFALKGQGFAFDKAILSESVNEPFANKYLAQIRDIYAHANEKIKKEIEITEKFIDNTIAIIQNNSGSIHNYTLNNTDIEAKQNELKKGKSKKDKQAKKDCIKLISDNKEMIASHQIQIDNARRDYKNARNLLVKHKQMAKTLNASLAKIHIKLSEQPAKPTKLQDSLHLSQKGSKDDFNLKCSSKSKIEVKALDDLASLAVFGNTEEFTLNKTFSEPLKKHRHQPKRTKSRSHLSKAEVKTKNKTNELSDLMDFEFNENELTAALASLKDKPVEEQASENDSISINPEVNYQELIDKVKGFENSQSDSFSYHSEVDYEEMIKLLGFTQSETTEEKQTQIGFFSDKSRSRPLLALQHSRNNPKSNTLTESGKAKMDQAAEESPERNKENRVSM